VLVRTPAEFFVVGDQDEGGADTPALLSELRRFYRASPGAKLRPAA
jgi:hypothetical protein